MRKIVAVLLCLVTLISCIPAFAVSAVGDTPKIGDKLIVTGSNVRFRTQPGTSTGTIIRELAYGTEVTLVGDFGEWANVSLGDKEGWISAQYLKKASEFSPPASTEHASILNKLNELRVKFPDGKYWNHVGFEENTSGFNKARPDEWTDTPCHTGSGGHPNTKWCNGQCDGWARKIGLDLFGTTPPWNGKSTKWERKYTLDGLCIGDLIRFGDWHTIVVTGFTEDPDYIIISDCNWDKKCIIDWDRGFSLSRYAPRGYYVEHYKGNTLDRNAYLNPGTTTATTTTTTTTTATTTTTTTTTAPTTTTTTTTTVPTTTTTTRPGSGGTGNTDVHIDRLGGSDRCDTAARISAEGWDSADAVVIASASGFADALAGVPLAYALNAPILLVSGDSLNEATAKEISRLGASAAYILGGNVSVSQSVEKQLTDRGLIVKRLSGDNRQETARRIAAYMDTVGAVKSDTVFFVSGSNFPDALAVSSVAAMTGSPVLYAPASGSIDKATADCLDALGAAKAVILGGEKVIGGDTMNSIAACGLEASRCGGSDRYETAVKICEKFSSLFSGKTVCLATGKNFPDALAGGVLAAKLKAPVVLVDAGSGLAEAKAFVGSVSPENAFVFGGKSVLSDALAEECVKG